MDMPVNLAIGKKDIIDWYDGVISGLLEFGDSATPHLCLCIAWSPEYDERVYALVPLEHERAARLRELVALSTSGEHWHEITSLMNDTVRGFTGCVAVIAADAVCKEVFGSATLHSDETHDIGPAEQRAEHAYDEPRLFKWLQRLGIPKPLSWREKEALEPDSDRRIDEPVGGDR